ncbi:MAG: ATP-binding protein [Sphingomonadales bacterium]
MTEGTFEAQQRLGLIQPADGGQILDAAPVPLLLIDPSHTVVAANTACRKLFAMRMIGKHLSSIVNHPDALEAVDGAIQSGKPVEQAFSLTGAKPRSFILGVGPIGSPDRLESTSGKRDAHRRVQATGGAILSFYETTTIRQTEKMRADFVANVSHELRTPLSSLIGFVETLRGPAADDVAAQERFLTIMAHEAGRMSRLIDDLLSLSRIELDEHLPPEGSADIKVILAGVVATHELRAAERDVHLAVELPPTALSVIGEADQLTQVFQNIVDNAIKYSPDGEPVTVAAAPAETLTGTGGPGISISVNNQGAPIPRQHMDRLTERFYRVDAARSRALGGTGLGLAIVKHIVSRHRGTLSITSDDESGTTVTVCLPAAATKPS